MNRTEPTVKSVMIIDDDYMHNTKNILIQEVFIDQTQNDVSN